MTHARAVLAVAALGVAAASLCLKEQRVQRFLYKGLRPAQLVPQ